MLRRKGVAAVEFAVVVPLLVGFIFGAIELGRAAMVQHVLEEASLAGCRMATLDAASKQQVLDMVDTAMAKASISGYSVTMNPDPPGQASPQDPVTVSVSIGYDQVTWLGSSWFMGGKSLTGRTVLPVVESEDSKSKKKAKTKSKAKAKGKAKGKAKAKAKAKA